MNANTPSVDHNEGLLYFGHQKIKPQIGIFAFTKLDFIVCSRDFSGLSLP